MLGHLCHCRHVSQLFRDALSRGNDTFARDVPKGLTLPVFPAALGPFPLRRHSYRLSSGASHLGVQAGSARSSELFKIFPVVFCPVSASTAATPGAESGPEAGQGAPASPRCPLDARRSSAPCARSRPALTLWLFRGCMEPGSFRKGGSKRGTRCTRFRFVWGVGGRSGGRISSLRPLSLAEQSHPPPTPRSSCSELGKEARGLNDKTKPRSPTKKEIKTPIHQT